MSRVRSVAVAGGELVGADRVVRGPGLALALALPLALALALASS
ncbi:hypothetical protein [Streptomyces beihaiensis]|uniref:Uncharacterized protein n=1 Tax=Streptomyces beihaiensis TaxID=2984495 RepID=A0ABT3U2X0_9ACTN|nr:hypothetical protein [Streptomyces beihaiensis]MCX3063656.1 hypothetical protein [Streptomyces beihaiensis]